MARNINVVLSLQDKFTKQMSNASYAAYMFNQRLGLAQAMSGKFKTYMKTMEVAAVGFGTAGIALGKQSLGTYKEFNAAMNEVAGIKQISTASAEYESLVKTAKEAAAEISGITDKDSADSLKYMGLAGWNTAQSLNALPAVLKAVRISGQDTKTVADALTDSMSALGLGSEKAAQYVDMATAVQSSSNTDMLQLQNALKKTGALYMNMYADMSGADIMDVVGDVSALVGILANVGIKDTKAGTVLNNIFNRFLKNTGETEKGFASLGMSLYNEKGNLKDISDIFTELYEKSKGLTQEERNKALSQIGGRFSSQLITLMDAFSEAGEGGVTNFEKITTAIEQSEGAADRFVESMGSGYAGAVDEMSASWYNFKTNMGEELAPYAVEFLGRVRDYLPELEDWLSDRLPGAAEGFFNLLEKGGNAVGFMAENIDKIVPSLVGLYGAMGAFRVGTGLVSAYQTVNKFATAAQSAKAANIAWQMTMMGTKKTAADVLPTVSKWGAAIGAVAPVGALLAGAAAIGVVGAAVYKYHQYVKKADIEKRFGNITMSAKELEKAVKDAFGQKAQAEVDSFRTSIEEYENAYNELSGGKDVFVKASFLISAKGLNEERKNSIISAAEEYAKNLEDVIAQRKITVKAALKMTFGETDTETDGTKASNINNAFDNFGKGLIEKAEEYGENLKKAIEDAYKNSWDNDTVQRIIDDYLSKMDTLNEKINNAESRAKMDSLQLKYSKSGLSEKTFGDFMAELETVTDENVKAQEDARQTGLAAAYIRYDEVLESQGKTAADAQLESDRKAIIENSNKNIAEIYGKAEKIAFDQLLSYFPEVSDYVNEEVFDKARENYENTINDYIYNPASRSEYKEMFGDLGEVNGDNPKEAAAFKGHFYPNVMKESVMAAAYENAGSWDGVPKATKENFLEYYDTLSDFMNRSQEYTKYLGEDNEELKSQIDFRNNIIKMLSGGGDETSAAVDAMTVVVGDAYDAGARTTEDAITDYADSFAKYLELSKDDILTTLDEYETDIVGRIDEVNGNINEALSGSFNTNINWNVKLNGGNGDDEDHIMGPEQPGHNALGTNYFSGGYTYINENGGEIVDLPRGSRIIPADKSRQIAEGGGGKGITVIVNIENMYGEDERYIYNIGERIANRLAETCL